MANTTSEGHGGKTCPAAGHASSNGAFSGDNPINFSIPLLIVQILVILSLTRGLAFLLRPLRQPRVVAEIIGGILLGPSAAGYIPHFTEHIFPTCSLNVLDTIAGVGLIFFLFLVGLELDLRSLVRTGKEALMIAAAGISFPFIAGIGTSFVLRETVGNKETSFGPFLVFMGVAMSITAFPVLARILAERKLLTTDVGQMAMSAAAVNDVVAWILLALAVALTTQGKSGVIAVWVLLCGAAYLIGAFLIGKPFIQWMAKQSPDSEPISEVYVAMTFALVLVGSFITDTIGIHAIFGSFVVGLIVPKDGTFAGHLIEKLEDFVSIIMLPLYFASSGLKTKLQSVKNGTSVGLLFLVIATACVGKIGGTYLLAMFAKLGHRKSLTLGVLMNTKGLVELIVLNIGLQKKVITEEIFTIMVIMALFTTFMTSPLVLALYAPARDQKPYKSRTMQASEKDAELRVMACVHGMRDVHATTSLIDTLRSKQGFQLRRRIHLFVLHLVELTERHSSILLVAQARREGRPFWSKERRQALPGDDVALAFDAYARYNKVNCKTTMEISRFSDMYEDICHVANERRASLILLPFHKVQLPDGGLELRNPGFKQVNDSVMRRAPCSVAILVDRGSLSQDGISVSLSSSQNGVAVIFTGGPDDREALAIGRRMVDAGVSVTVIRFVSSTGAVPAVAQEKGAVEDKPANALQLMRTDSQFHITIDEKEVGKEDALDQAAVKFVTTKMTGVTPTETLAREGSEKDGTPEPTGVMSEKNGLLKFVEQPTDDPVADAVKLASEETYRLLIVGRGRRPSPMIIAAAEKLPHTPFEDVLVDHHGLGVLGDALTSNDPALRASILIVQQFDEELQRQSNMQRFGSFRSLAREAPQMGRADGSSHDSGLSTPMFLGGEPSSPAGARGHAGLAPPPKGPDADDA